MVDGARPRVPCVGALVHDDEGRLLVVRRRNEPGAGRWSVPGGRVEPGESDLTAVRREVLEETGLHVTVGLLRGHGGPPRTGRRASTTSGTTPARSR